MTDTTSLDSSLRVRGSNHEGMRQFNERIVLQAIRLHGAMPKAELARVTQLSKQTVSIIVERLLNEHLLIKQERIRGGIGQPSVPLALNPQGSFSIGIQVGRRSLEVLVADFCGHIVNHHITHYEYPDPLNVISNVEEIFKKLQYSMAERWSRVVGIGLAAPLALHQWGHIIGGEAAPALAQWETYDLKTEIEQLSGFNVMFARDTVAACTAELLLGHGQVMPSFLYVYVGTFVGGGLVLQGRLLTGDRGNAGAIGSIPLSVGSTSVASQLLEIASGWQLEQALKLGGQDPHQALKNEIIDQRFDEWTLPWLDQASNALAMTSTAATALLDLDAIVIDGSLAQTLLDKLVLQTQTSLKQYNHAGIRSPLVLRGALGRHARALGGALLPMHMRFFPDKNIFLKKDLV